MAKNPIRKVWEENRAAYGLWLVVPGSFGAELMGRVGADYVCVDVQHGILGYDAMVPMFQAINAAGVAPIARVVQNDPGEMGKALDAGAWGVIVPLVSNAQEAARAVAACRYPPRGMRSYGPVRASAATGLSDPDELGAEALCLVMIETREGLNNVEEIAATPGLDGIYIGPGDLALSLGLPPTQDVTEDEHVEAVRRIREACHDNGIAAGMHGVSGEQARRYAEAGFDMVNVGVDSVLLVEAARRELATALGERVEPGTGGGY
jgi:4-hydroxy-2-oxoheptanedioate aldolase